MILSTTEAADRLRADLGDHLANIALEQSKRHDLSRRGVQLAAIHAALDERNRQTALTAPTPTAAVACHIAERVRAQTLTRLQALDDPTGCVWADASRWIGSARVDLVSRRAAKSALERRAELEQERVTLAARNPAAAEWEAVVQEAAAKEGRTRPRAGSTDAEKNGWWRMIDRLRRQHPRLAALAQGRNIDPSDGRMTPPSGGARLLQFDKNGRLVRSPAA